jgi:hypothetical protein
MKHLRYAILAEVLFLLAAAACGHGGSQDPVSSGSGSTITLQVENMILPGAGGPCSPFVQNNETIKMFLPDGPPGGIGVPYNEKSKPYQLAPGSACGLGIQVNFWYWIQEPGKPVGKGPPQNPDNSGASLLLNPDCTFTAKPPCFGSGKETYAIADVSSAMKDGVCVVSVRPNRYTGCVTPACCSPYDGTGKCPDILPRTYECADPPR